MFTSTPRAAPSILMLCCISILLSACGGIGQSGDSSSDLNNPPVFTTPTRFVVPENNRDIATLSATDADGDTITYEIIGGEDEERFSLDSETGAFSFANNPNYESPGDNNDDNLYIVRVQATDQRNTHQLTITVVVTDVNERLSFTTPSRILVEELATAVATIRTNDPENSRITFSVTGGDDQALFHFDPNTGALMFLSAPAFDAPGDSDGNNQYAISIAAFDGSTTITRDFTVIVHREIDVALSSDIKSLTFDWPNYFGATHYKVFVNPDGDSGFSQLGDDLASHELVQDISVHVTDWLNATYFVEAHDAGGMIGFSQPFTITDHLLNTIGYFKASNTDADDAFGAASALSANGNTLAVGAPGEDSNGSNQASNAAGQAGAVYVYARIGGQWRQQAYLKSLEGDSAAEFGASLALDASGDTLVVGAPGTVEVIIEVVEGGIDNTIILPDTGAAYVFTRDGATWGRTAALVGDDTVTNDRFGSDVVIDDASQTLLVGAPGTAGGGTVYAFNRDAELWTQADAIAAANAEPGDQFGADMALNAAGNVLAVGAPGEDGNTGGIDGVDNNDAPDAGAVYLFNQTINGWEQQHYVKASNSGDGHRFGERVVLNEVGDVLAIGAPDESGIGTEVNGDPTQDAAFEHSGAAYLFNFENLLWSQRAYVKSPAPTLGDRFGASLALNASGNLLAVGAPFEDGGSLALNGDPFDESLPGAGAVYLYHLPEPLFAEQIVQWVYDSYLKAPNSGIDDHFGAGVAFAADGDTLAVGAPGEASAATDISGDRDDDTASGSGAAYLY